MKPEPSRFYVHDTWPPWLRVLVGVLLLAVLLLYFTAPDVPKFEILPAIGLLGVVLFLSHRASRSWIEISPHQKVSYVPSWYARKLWGEPVKSVVITRSSEIHLCHNTSYGFFDGFSLILRSPGGGEECLWKNHKGLNYRRAAKFAKQVTHDYDLPVRLITRIVGPQGIDEEEWTPATGKVEKKIIAMAFLPLTGIFVRLLTRDPGAIALSAGAIWIVVAVTFWLISRRHGGLREVATLGEYVWWAFRFSLYYVIIVVVTGALIDG